MKHIILICSFFFLSLNAFSQTGTLRGIIRDGKTNEAVIGATVQVMGLATPMGGSTDVNGQFELGKVPAGLHIIQISYVSYVTRSILNVRIESGNATVLETDLVEDNKTLQEVVVKAGRTTNTEIAVVTEIKQIKAMAVGVSAQQIQKAQDRDAAAAIRRVPGVSIVDNRFVLIRGLGARYNSVLINDVIAPSTEIDTRSFSFDLVPSNILDRMIVYKSGLAELPGDFAGGVVKIYTKRRPEQNYLDVGLTIGYREGTTGRSVQTHERGGLNLLGLWDRTQQLPTSFPTSAAEFNNQTPVRRASFARLLPNNWALQQITAAPDVRLAINTGRRFDAGDVKLSNITSFNYSVANQFANVDLRLYENGTTANDIQQQYNDANFTRSTRVGLLHNWTARFSPNFSLEWKTQFNQLGNTQTIGRTGQFVIDGQEVQSFSQRFENRSILTSQVLGEHTLNELTKVNWIASYGYSGRWEPDWRRARYIRTLGSTGPDGQPEPFGAVLPFQPDPINAGRFYSRLNEHTGSLIGNFERILGTPTDREPSRLKAGFYTERRQRDFNARFYGYEGVGAVRNVATLPVGQLFAPENVVGREGSLTIEDGTLGIDSYTGNSTYLAGYISGDFYFGPRANLTVGFRGESFNQTLRSAPRQTIETLVDRTLFSPLPSVNFTYKLTDKHNLRVAYSATVNRPELRELAPFRYYDFERQSDVRGNPALLTATIQNVDLKYEYYPTPGEVFSVSGFYKQFKNPIEIFQLPISGNLAYTYFNAPSARNFGVEIEFRKSFAESSSLFLKNIQLVGNASIIDSRVRTDDVVLIPDLSGTLQPFGNTTNRNRPLTSQSPYLINFGAYYANPTSGWQANVLYNVAGPRIFIVGNLDAPTTYEMPRHVVDLNVARTFASRYEIRLGIQDIFNAPFRFAQDFNENGRIDADVTSRTANADQNYLRFRRGQYITLTGVYTFGRRIIVP